jgi:hypothetical protein
MQPAMTPAVGRLTPFKGRPDRAAEAVDSCTDCYAWGVTKADGWLCNGCRSWRANHERTGTCVACAGLSRSTRAARADNIRVQRRDRLGGLLHEPTARMTHDTGREPHRRGRPGTGHQQRRELSGRGW